MFSTYGVVSDAFISMGWHVWKCSLSIAGEQENRPAKRPKTLKNSFAVPQQSAETFREELALAVVTGNISFNFYENHHLIKAANALGVY